VAAMESRDEVQEMWRPWSLGMRCRRCGGHGVYRDEVAMESIGMRWPGCDKRLAIMSVRIQAGPLGPHSNKIIIAAVDSKEMKKKTL
jgi:hypothetical protein